MYASENIVLKYMKQTLLELKGKLDIIQEPTVQPCKVVPSKWILQLSADSSPSQYEKP